MKERNHVIMKLTMLVLVIANLLDDETFKHSF